MKIIKKVFKRLKSICLKILKIIKVVISSLLYRNKMYLFGAPISGNIGDQAILLGEKNFLNDFFPNMKIIYVESNIVMKFYKILKKVVKKSIILVNGGGFLGTLWKNEEDMFRKTIETFPNNTIIVFPQTIYFSNGIENEKILQESKKIYQSHKRLYICCREEYSFEYMKKEFPLCNILLIPDIVLYLDKMEDNTNRENVLFCIRRDKEKIKYDFEQLKIYLKKEKNLQINYTDTVIQKNISNFKGRKKEVNKKLEEFRKYRLIVTDRLHGMVFAFLTKTPCLVFQNVSYKVKGVYEWIKAANYIKLSTEDNMIKAAEDLLEITEKEGNDENLKNKYEPLVQLIKENIK